MFGVGEGGGMCRRNSGAGEGAQGNPPTPDAYILKFFLHVLCHVFFISYREQFNDLPKLRHLLRILGGVH